MLTILNEIDIQNNDWIKNKKTFHSLKALDMIAVDSVLFDLSAGYEESQGDIFTTFKDIYDNGYWSGDNYYVPDEVYIICVNDKYMIFDHLYVTNTDNIVLVAYTVKDVWADQDDILAEIEGIDPQYFTVDY